MTTRSGPIVTIGTLTDIFAIQSEIAHQVALRLSAQLSPRERKGIEEKPTNNLEAYDLYLQAKPLLDTLPLWGSEEKIDLRAISLLEQATQKDPQFALAYCLIAKAHDFIYVRTGHTPERRVLANAAANEALRLRPDLPQVHLAVAHYLYYCERDSERARRQISIAAQGLSNSPDLLELSAFIDLTQGNWESGTTGLERAAILDPRNVDLLGNVAHIYGFLRRYRDCERISNRLIELEPDQRPVLLLYKVWWVYAEKADLQGARAACEALPSSLKDDPQAASFRVYYAMCARDFGAAEAILGESPNKEILWVQALVPRQIFALWLEFLQGNHPTMKEFGGAREQLYRKVEADPTNPYLTVALAYADLALGRKEESIQEGRRAMEMRPISKDALSGANIATMVAEISGFVNQLDFAFEQLNILVKMPGYLLNYGNLKTNPGWDPLRKDPRFDKLLAELAPKD